MDFSTLHIEPAVVEDCCADGGIVIRDNTFFNSSGSPQSIHRFFTSGSQTFSNMNKGDKVWLIVDDNDAGTNVWYMPTEDMSDSTQTQLDDALSNDKYNDTNILVNDKGGTNISTDSESGITAKTENYALNVGKDKASIQSTDMTFNIEGATMQLKANGANAQPPVLGDNLEQVLDNLGRSINELGVGLSEISPEACEICTNIYSSILNTRNLNELKSVNLQIS